MDLEHGRLVRSDTKRHAVEIGGKSEEISVVVEDLLELLLGLLVLAHLLIKNHSTSRRKSRSYFSEKF